MRYDTPNQTPTLAEDMPAFMDYRLDIIVVPLSPNQATAVALRMPSLEVVTNDHMDVPSDLALETMFDLQEIAEATKTYDRPLAKALRRVAQKIAKARR